MNLKGLKSKGGSDRSDQNQLSHLALTKSNYTSLYGHNLTILAAIAIVCLVSAPLADLIIAISLTWYLVHAFQPNP